MNAHSPRIDLDAYFERIGFGGRHEGVARYALHCCIFCIRRRFPSRISIRCSARPVRLDPESIQKKLVALPDGAATATNTICCFKA